MSQIEELVVLVDEDNNETGTMPKLEVHGADTPPHRGFSAFLFNTDNKLLVQQRSHKKVTWPLMWSNSVCGHPLPGENTEAAVERRAAFELGLEVSDLTWATPYRYRFERDGIVENEICPVYIGRVIAAPTPNPDEVEAVKWLTWSDFLAELKTQPDLYSEWCHEEAEILEDEKIVKRFLEKTH